jgi:hypothetical protein
MNTFILIFLFLCLPIIIFLSFSSNAENINDCMILYFIFSLNSGFLFITFGLKDSFLLCAPNASAETEVLSLPFFCIISRGNSSTSSSFSLSELQCSSLCFYL